VAPHALGQRGDQCPLLVQQLDATGVPRREVEGHAREPVVRPRQGAHHEHRPLAAVLRADGRRVDQPAEVVDGRAADGVAQVVRLPPAGEQVEVDLVGLCAGDGVVVRVEQ
jgi:hypothetical protein